MGNGVCGAIITSAVLSQFVYCDIMVKKEINLRRCDVVRKIILLTATFILIIGTCYASTTKVLTQDTELHPQGWIAGAITFQKGTVVVNDNGEVITGNLAFYEHLRPVGSAYEKEIGGRYAGPRLHKNDQRIIFKPDSPVTFNEEGQAISGYIANACSVVLVGKRDYFVRFQERSLLVFNADGSVSQGTLAEDTYMRPLGWRNYLPIDDGAGFLNFKSGTETFFGPAGQIIKGTIQKDFATVSGKQYKAGTTLKFSEASEPEIAQ